MKLFNKKPVIALLMITVSMFSNVTAQQKNAIEKPLTPKQQSIITIAAFTSKGDLVKLKKELNSGLEAGLTVNQIKEAIVHLYAYCGFPRSIRDCRLL